MRHKSTTSNTPMLQPMRFGEILDTTFSLYRKYFLLFLGIIAIHFIGKLVEYSLRGFFRNFRSIDFIASVVSDPIAILSMGGIIVATATIYLGKHITSRAALRYTLQRFFPMLGAHLLWLLFFAIPLIGISSFLTRRGPGVSAALLAMFLVCIPIPTYFVVRWLFVVEVVLLEKSSVGSSLKRSSQLVRGAWWRVFSVSISFLILGAAIGVIFKVSVGCILVLTKVADGTDFMGIIRWAIRDGAIDSSNLPLYTIMTCTDLVLDSLTFPIWVIGITLLYFDLRIRKEGFDIETQVDNGTTHSPEPVAS